MDSDKLSNDLKNQSIFLKSLSEDLEHITYDLKFCPEIEILDKQLKKIKKLSVEIFSIVNGMEVIKRMSEI